MPRDSKSLRRNSGRNNSTEEAENLPQTLNPRDYSNPKIITDPSRPPLNTIPEPSRIPKTTSDHDLSGFKPSKFNRTPTKPKHTPDKQGTLSKKRVNWAQKGEHSSTNNLSSNGNTPSSARANVSYAECYSAQTTPTKSVSKPPNAGFSSSSGSRPVPKMGARMMSLSKGILGSCNLPAVVNTVEAPCFELKEDPSFWMEHNVQVLIRVRPLNTMEKSSFGYSRCLKQESGQSITWIGQPETRFMYDHVACEAIDQEALFGMVGLPMVENCLSGYNSCMFAYGQTGSGKTHTMLGEIEALEVKPSPNRGMTPRIFEFLFARIREEEEIRRGEHLKYNCKCSFLEIYNEQITDLLDPSSTNLMLREDMKKGVYVENLSEFEVHTVGDILQLLTQGASNRKVAATNMNRESSRSHSVFTCVIESTWEKDSVSNFRFARLNLVDLAGSERQKSSGAEGERLKEAANINKSLSTLGHVIMVLVDVANGKPRHIPYRDSRLTFLLQDSLGGNSKTMIIANVSPSICSAAETLNTLKFAQRAKLIQNNAVINEDSSGDVVALKHQVQLLKEELSALKREKVTRTLSFGESCIDTSIKEEDNDCSEQTHVKENGFLRVPCEQLRSLESTLAGALRREQMAETTVRQLQAEIHQLNRLVSQREEDTRCRKMMLKFREDKIQRMESVLGGIMPMDDYLVRENKALSEENQLLRERVDKNPEVTRFAVENIRLLDQVRQFQDLYEEGEKEMLMNEVCELRNQLISSLDENLKQPNHLDIEGSNSNDSENNLLHEELKITLSELEGSKKKLNCFLEENATLQREIEELRASLSATTQETDSSAEVLKESIVGVPMVKNSSITTTLREKEGTRSESHVNVEDIMYLQLELDIVKIILQEQRSAHVETAEIAKSLNRELQLSKETVISLNKDYERVLEELKNAKYDIEVEAETSEVIIHLQKELAGLQQEVYYSKAKETETSERLVLLETMRAEWDVIAYEMEHILSGGDESLRDVSDQIDVISVSIPNKTNLVSENFGKVKKYIFQKEVLIEELSRCLKEALKKSDDMECMLKSLRGAALVMTQAHQQECCEKNKEILRMTSEISSKTSTVEELQGLIEHGRDQLKTASSCATAAFVVVNRLWESNCNYRDLVIDVAENEGNNNILETREKLKELNSGVSEIKLNINDYVKIGGCKLSRTGTRIEEDTDDINSVNLASERAVNSVNGRDDSIILLKKEIEFGLKRLQEVQVEMDKLRFEKEEVLASEKTGRKRIDSTINQVVILEDAIENFRGEFEIKVDGLERKIEKLEEIIHQSFASWVLLRDLLEDELGGAIVIAAQKTIEASCILEKFEEVQDNVKEADVMINELMMANEALKLNAHESKARENNLTGERDVLAKEVKSLEKQYGSDFDIMTRAVSELENVISEIQMATVKEWTSVFPDFFTMKSQFQESTTLIKIMLEEVWSEIIAKDCTMSVLHLCHMGILLDTANGLHTENNLLEHGLCKSNSVVSELREHNLKSRNELEMCIVLKGKLLVDITKGFNQISSKVDENGEVSLKLASFEKNIQNLQFQEEMLLERSNDMVSELGVIMKELDLCNKYTVASIMDYESLLKEKDGLIQNQEESFVIELLAKDFELLVLSSELKQVALLKEDAEKAHLSTYGLLENLKKDVVFKSLETASCELLLLEKENRYEKLLRDFKTNELALETSSSHISELYQKIRKLQNELELKHGEFGKLSCLEKENEELQVRLNKSKAGYSLVLQEFEDRKAALDIENQELRDSMAKLEEDLRLAKLKIENHEVSQCIVKDGLQNQLENVNTLKTENTLLRNELRVYEGNQSEYLNCLNLKMLKNLDLAENVDKASLRIINLIEKKLVEVEDKFQSIVNEMDNTNELLDQFECMGNIALKLDSETSRKDDILKGVLFDLSLLQESASNSKDQKDEMKEVLHSVSILKRDYELKSSELEKAVAEGQSLEARLQEKMEHISVLELELSRGQEVINSLSSKNAEVLDGAKEAFDAKNSMEKEFLEARIKIEDLEMVLGQMSKTIDSLKCDTDSVTCQRDDLCSKVLILSKELETARALAQENAEIAIEAKEKAEIQKVDAEEKEEEVRLLERSIEELEFTINVLEQKVDIVKGEAERQRRQRGELELELLGFKEQMQNIKINDSDLKRCLDEKEMNHKESLLRVKLLEKEIAARDTEISRCKAHICELNLHAEAQASEHKQRFKALEAMVEKLKYEVSTTHSTSSPKKLEKIPSKFKGSGSPFKCIGLGIVQQIRSEKDEELTAGRQRIEELEDLATSRQKEILMLRARLASTESMTHDVIRDLLGVKLNMKNYGNLMDNQQLHSLMGKTQHHNFDDNVKNQDVSNLKLQINEFVKERNGWLEEIERKQAKMMSAHVALEKLRQQEKLLATENEMLKLENAKHRKKVMGLEDEVTNLSGQQNIQQRIHHHAKTKEENNSLKFHNEELRFKLRRTESILSSVKDELAQFRAANGKNPYINFDMEEQLDMKLKETEEEKVQLAQKLLGLCTTVLKAAGITKPTSEISISVAEVVLVQLKNRVVSLEMELEDVKLKNRISDERTMLLELQPQTSTESSSSSDMVRNRASQTPFFSSLDR